jgi:hypothetical protein
VLWFSLSPSLTNPFPAIALRSTSPSRLLHSIFPCHLLNPALTVCTRLCSPEAGGTVLGRRSKDCPPRNCDLNIMTSKFQTLFLKATSIVAFSPSSENSTTTETVQRYSPRFKLAIFSKNIICIKLRIWSAH